MKIHYPGDRGKLWFSSIVTLALAMILADAGAIRSQPLQIAPGFPEPLGVSGVSGGANNSGDCGFVSQAPNHVIEVTQDLPYWRIAVETAGASEFNDSGAEGAFLRAAGEFCCGESRIFRLWGQGDLCYFCGRSISRSTPLLSLYFPKAKLTIQRD